MKKEQLKEEEKVSILSFFCFVFLWIQSPTNIPFSKVNISTFSTAHAVFHPNLV